MLNLKLINRGTECELLMAGRLDTNSAGDADKIIQDTIVRFDSMILNMAQLEYVSSAGLRVLKRAHFAMRRKGGTLSLRNVGKMVMEVFEVTGFAGLFQFV